jgi:site-specific recombinase XerD
VEALLLSIINEINMNMETIPVNQLFAVGEKALSYYQLKESTARERRKGLRQLHSIMSGSNLIEYKLGVGEACVIKLLEEGVVKYRIAILRKAVALLNCYMCGEEILCRYDTKKRIHYFPGEIGKIAQSYIVEKTEIYRMHPDTVNRYENSLSYFSSLMNLRGVNMSSLLEHDILFFLTSIKNNRYGMGSPVKCFLQYCYETKIITKDFRHMFAGIRASLHAKLPSYYTGEEILKIESSVNRHNNTGKRDYGILLLASRLGLRRHDIANIRLDNFDWHNNTISLIQQKTGKEIILPILSDVGDAIIDYALYGRPKTESRYVFVSFINTQKPVSKASVTSIVSKYIRKSGVSTHGRHHGPHSLRHSIAQNMVNNGVKLPVVSENLGHKSMQSTMYYMGVCVNDIMNCSNDVPPVNNVFYEQKGGILYE